MAPVRVGGNIKTPTKVKDVRPVYPPDARAAGIQGVVILETTIDTEGRVSDAKVLRSIRIPHLDQVPLFSVAGQYGPARVGNEDLSGFREEEGVDPNTQTDTYSAVSFHVDNWRWAGVPIYLRTGKRMAEGQRIISIAFKEAPRTMFPAGSGVGSQGPDHLTFDLADASKVSLSFYGKRPGPGDRKSVV